MCALASMLVITMLVGCESEGTVALTVDPPYADLSGGATNQNQTFTVVDGLRSLSLPLEWQVSNPGLGHIGASGGSTASYVRTGGSGDNSISVRDQYGAEGVATVHQ